ncbi:cardiolipin synthase [Pontibacillus litoralis]|uniref:cardiolipin synthase n=1 Tax=Pontibacillus litoralis TaxID=516703 RepID=UPI001E58F8FA|nr:cardiolipin synthase [Pontibacillus litoralis]
MKRLILLLSLLVLCIIAGLLWIDYTLGKKQHMKHVRSLEFDEQLGDCTLYTIGDSFLTNLFHDIQNAEAHIDMLFFIVKKDAISMELLHLLKKKATQGVTVRFMLDRIGGYRVNRAMIKDLKKAGVQFTYTATPRFPFFFYQLNRRNHRKITIIDGKVAYVGGFNVAKEYISRDPRLGNWRDYHLRVVGRVIHPYAAVFNDDWDIANGEQKHPIVKNTNEGNKEMRIIATDGPPLEQVFHEMIEEAEQEICIGTPYFIPSERLFQSLLAALKRGVHVHVIVPMKSDHPLVKEAGLHYLYRLRAAGGDVYFFDLGFYHAKVFIVDQKYCDIGTANFDRRSLYLNQEINTLIYDQAFVEEVRLSFDHDMQDSQPFHEHYTQQFHYGTKIRMGLAYILRPFL